MTCIGTIGTRINRTILNRLSSKLLLYYLFILQWYLGPSVPVSVVLLCKIISVVPEERPTQNNKIIFKKKSLSYLGVECNTVLERLFRMHRYSSVVIIVGHEVVLLFGRHVSGQRIHASDSLDFGSNDYYYYRNLYY